MKGAMFLGRVGADTAAPNGLDRFRDPRGVCPSHRNSQYQMRLFLVTVRHGKGSRYYCCNITKSSECLSHICPARAFDRFVYVAIAEFSEV